MNKTELMSKLANILQVSATNLTEDFALTADNWDSVAHLGAIAVIDEVCGIIVPTNEMKECGTVGELVRLIEKNLSII